MNPEMDLIDDISDNMNKTFFQSFLSLRENVFSIPGQDLDVKFSSDQEFPTTFKAVSSLESIRDEVELYEINQFIKVRFLY